MNNFCAKLLKNLIAFKVYIILMVFFLSCTGTQNQPSEIPVNEYGNPGYVISFNPKKYICYKTHNQIIIDGKADEDIWQATPWNIEFADILGDHFPKPTFLTRAKMLWNNYFLFIIAEMSDPNLKAGDDEKAEICDNNFFSILIDNNGDTHNFIELQFNVNGRLNLFNYKSNNFKGEKGNLNKLRAIKSSTYVEGTINTPYDEDKYWSLEVAIPISLLTNGNNTIAFAGTQWRMNFNRSQFNYIIVDGYYKKEINSETGKIYPNENWVWAPIGENNIYKPELWGFVQFSDNKINDGKDKFNYNTDEDLKWELRNIYYAQNRYFLKNGTYAKKIKDLKSVGFKTKALKYKPKIKHNTDKYTISAKTANGQLTWNINSDGLVWPNNNE